MPPFRRMNRKNARKALLRLADMIEQDDHDGPVLINELNSMLDDLLADDFFGTEGQNDPRGDHRSYNTDDPDD